MINLITVQKYFQSGFLTSYIFIVLLIDNTIRFNENLLCKFSYNMYENLPFFILFNYIVCLIKYFHIFP
jgi:hypothetical protein